MILICGVVENSENRNLYDVSLTDGEVRVTAEGVKLWNTDAESLEDTFYEWLEFAQNNEPGFTISY